MFLNRYHRNEHRLKFQVFRSKHVNYYTQNGGNNVTMNADSIDKLPCDVWVEVFQYGCLDEALKVHDLSEAFERACCLAVRKRMTDLRYGISLGVSNIRKKLDSLPASYDSHRLAVLKTVVLLKYLTTEVNIFFSTVWSHSEHKRAWIFLCPHLLPVINEFENLLKSSMNLDVRREELTTFNMRMVLNSHFEFLRKYDSELLARLIDIKGSWNFEIEALDILMCCPSINFQLSLSSVIGDERTYDIASFFGFYNLKPVFQVPDVHNSSLTTEMKKVIILRYLRECVQWENLTFLQTLLTDINDLEFRVQLPTLSDDMRLLLIMRLFDRYETIHHSPYPLLHRNIYVSKKGKYNLLKENYCRFSSCNANMTGLYVVLNTWNQPPENLPLLVHHLRGQLKPLMNEKIVDSGEVCQNLLDCSSSTKYYKKNRKLFLQLCINYREGFNSCPAESIINVIYDSQNICHISSNYIESEPFQQPNVGINIEEE